MPLQVADSLTLILDAAEFSSAWESFRSHAGGSGYFRPLFYAEIKLLFDLAHGHYQLTYRLFHAASVFAFVMLFVRALDVRSRATLVVVPLALTVFFGMHTFLATVKEIYPVSHFLQVGVLALAALNLAQSKGGRLIDVALIATFVAAALTIESGLLVWVVVAAAWMAGAPGVSTRVVIAVSVLFVGYFIVRFGVYHTEMPLLCERSAGFLLARGRVRHPRLPPAHGRPSFLEAPSGCCLLLLAFLPTTATQPIGEADYRTCAHARKRTWTIRWEMARIL